jgi:uncharacterized protein
MTSDMAWIRTFSGRKFRVLDARPVDVHIEDIAHALSLQCRFVGHVKTFYSVAQHSVLVSRFCPPEHALYGLLHDAAEAFLGDMSAPLKHQPEMSKYRTAEKHVMAAIGERFGLTIKEPQEVKDVDRRMLLTEARDLLSGGVEGWYTEYKPFIWTVHPWVSERAEREFLHRYDELTGQRVMATLSWRDDSTGYVG